ncbi:MAG: hypothetical protein WCX29_01340 [Candidatus Peribacteraceae bacterium]
MQAFRTLKRHIHIVALGTVSMVTAFTLGMHTTASVHPVELIEAGGTRSGDMDGDGALALNDVRIVLEILNGYREATPEQRAADIDDDGVLTIDDALRMLFLLERQ